MKRLPIEKQIELLKLTIKDINVDYVNNGICCYISFFAYRLKYIDKLFSHDNFDKIQKLVPSFNKTNALRLCKKYNFEKPDNKCAWWWNKYNKKVRIDFLNALITELKLKLE